MPLQEQAEILSNRQVKEGYYLMELKAPNIAKEAKPGQFVHIRVGNTMDPLLRRPISLYGIDADKGSLTLLYVVVGRGTQLMSEMASGEKADIMGPLGRGFWVPENASRILIIGGGIGVAPLLPIIKTLQDKGRKIEILYGYRDSDNVIGIDQIEEKGWPLKIATDDGSVGHKGFVTELAGQAIEEFKPDYYYTCGPEPMIRNVVKLMQNHGIDGQVSLEARMGCGVGACLACTCKTKPKTNGQEFDYKLVCTQGPVFTAEEVMLNE